VLVGIYERVDDEDGEAGLDDESIALHRADAARKKTDRDPAM
jgi:hypothetical protein